MSMLTMEVILMSDKARSLELDYDRVFRLSSEILRSARWTVRVVVRIRVWMV